MRHRKAARGQGKITSWKDDQGFGFITPNGGGPAVFVHIKSFPGQHTRPAANDIVTYDLAVNDKGQPRAENVAFVRPPVPRRTAARKGIGALLAAAGFFGIVAACVLAGILPPLALAAYLGMSVLAFLAYAVDKSAARGKRRRTPESTLHTLGLLGGWPGALLAQQVFRHKSKKASFRKTFWLTVAIHCVVLAWLLSPFGPGVLR